MKQKTPWFKDFQIISYVVGGIAALGTAIVFTARYIELPSKVEAAEQKNVAQDKILDRLTVIEEQNQKLISNQAANQANQANQSAQRSQPTGLREWDDDKQSFYCCDLDDRNECFDKDKWEKCD